MHDDMLTWEQVYRIRPDWTAERKHNGKKVNKTSGTCGSKQKAQHLIVQIPEGEKESEAERGFKEIIAENSSNLGKHITYSSKKPSEPQTG